MQEENNKKEDIVSEVAEVPISAVKTTVEVEEEGAKLIGHAAAEAITFPYKKRRSIIHFFWRSKSGVITGAADNDPSAIVTYTQTGAVAGLKLLWMALLAWPLLTIVEEMSARIGVVAKKGINAVIYENYGKFWAYLVILVLLLVNTITLGADIAAMSDVAMVLTGIPEIIFIFIFGGLFFLLLWKKGYREVSRYLFILTPIFLLYILSAFLLPVPWGEALRNTFVPNFQFLNTSLMLVAVAFLGTTLTPAMIFWETSQEIEDEKTVDTLKQENTNVAFGMFYSQFVTFFIIVAAAAVFAGQNHIITTAKEASQALQPLGNVSFILFSLGILGSGLISIPVIAASSGYMFAETFHIKHGLDKKVGEAKGFYLVMILSLIIGVVIALLRFNPILALLYSQVLAGLLTPILLIFLLLITNSRKIMGPHTNRFWSNFFGIIAILVMITADIALVIQWIK